MMAKITKNLFCFLSLFEMMDVKKKTLFWGGEEHAKASRDMQQHLVLTSLDGCPGKRQEEKKDEEHFHFNSSPKRIDYSRELKINEEKKKVYIPSSATTY